MGGPGFSPKGVGTPGTPGGGLPMGTEQGQLIQWDAVSGTWIIVPAAALADGVSLVFDTASGLWMPTAPGAAGGGLPAGSTVGQLLMWNGTDWVVGAAPGDPGNLLAWSGTGWAATPNPRLEGWWRADDVAAGAVAVWPDRTPWKRNLLQPTGTNQPTAFANGGLNNQAYVRFDGVDNWMNAVFTFNQPEHVFLVAKANSVQVFPETILDGATVASTMRFLDNGTDSSMFAGTAFDPAIATAATAWHYYELLYQGANSTMRRDDGVSDGGDPGANNAGGITLGSLGSHAAGFADWDVAELLAFSFPQTGGALLGIRRYFLDRYGI